MCDSISHCLKWFVICLVRTYVSLSYVLSMSSSSVLLGCVMGLLLILFTLSSIARYYLKFTMYITMAMAFATLHIPIMLLRPFNPKNALMPAALLRLAARLLGIRWTVRGLENVDNTQGCVVVINHQSCLDLLVLAVLWPLMHRATVVSKRALQLAVPFGTAAWLWGTLFIDRGAKSARQALNQQVVAVKEHKRKLLLFPEGTRHSGDKLLPFKKGAFHVAANAGAPIQPVVVSKYHFLDAKRYLFGSGEVIITIMPLVPTHPDMVDDISTLVEKTHVKMQEQFTYTSAETLARRNNYKKACT